MTKTQAIQQYMNKLGLTEEEALELWLDEQNDNLPDLTDEQKKVVKEMTQADRKVEPAPRKRERKPDADKRILIDHFYMVIKDELVSDGNDVIITNPEREITFTFNGNRYRLTLSKPREKKG